MKLFIFPSTTTTNIWAGIGAGLWAVKEGDAKRTQELTSKAKQMTVGSAGVIWRTGEEYFTTPFLVYSQPEPGKKITDVWPEPWILPFRVHTLGTPSRRLPKAEAWKKLPVLKNSGKTNIMHVLRANALTSFVPSEVSDVD